MTDEVCPRLRDVEAFPVEQDGRRALALRDPAGYTDAVVLLPEAAVAVVALFDGHRTIADVQAELMRRHGALVAREEIHAIAAALDAQGFLDSRSFAERRKRVDAAFRAASARPAAHAGRAYPDEAGALRAMLDDLFAAPVGATAGANGDAPGAPLRGLVAPHIDFHRGGPAYAAAYRDLAARSEADLFVVLGTCHAGMPDPFALTRKDYQTPLGPVPVDRDVVEALARRAGPECFASELAHRAEHSIEFQAVVLRYLLGARRAFTMVPVLASFAHEAMRRGRRPRDEPRVARFVEALGETLAASGRRALVIAGADLAHVGPRFGDPAPVDLPALARVAQEDAAMLATVETGDAEEFFDAVARDDDRRRICGFSPIYSLLATLAGARGRVRHYGRWPDPQGTVTFASVVF